MPLNVDIEPMELKDLNKYYYNTTTELHEKNLDNQHWSKIDQTVRLFPLWFSRHVLFISMKAQHITYWKVWHILMDMLTAGKPQEFHFNYFISWGKIKQRHQGLYVSCSCFSLRVHRKQEVMTGIHP